MLERFFPLVVDNSYHGPKAALWLLGIVAVVKLLMGLNSIFQSRFVLTSADGVPLASYSDDAARSVVAFFSLWAWSLVLFSLVALLILTRYQSLVPLAFTLLLAEHLGRKLILQLVPIARTATATATWINLALVALMVVGLLLSLLQRRVVIVAG